MELRMESCKITGGFWAERQERIARSTIWRQLEILKGDGRGLRPEQRSPVVEGFLIAAGRSDAPYRGRVYSDSELGKWMEAAAYSLQQYPDAALERELDELVELIRAAQMPDGYINTYFQVLRPEDRLKHFAFSCELYNMGHLMEAAAAVYRCLSKREMLDAMCRAADLLCERIGPESGQAHVYDGHAEIELGLLRLYEATGIERYRSLAQYFVDERGRQPCFFLSESLLGDNDTGANDKWFGPDHHQAHAPLREQRDADGHAVKLTYLCSAAADLMRMRPDPELLIALDRLWDSTTRRRMYVTGAIGSQGYAERFTIDYDLPPERGYLETCASIGLCFWASRMRLLRRCAEYGDVFERALYNGVLAGWSQSGDEYFYVNTLSSRPEMAAHREDMKHVSPVRQPWFECACCPSNVLRLVASLQSYLFIVEPDALCIEHYACADADLTVDGQPVKIKMETSYPYDGEVFLRITAGTASQFGLRFRLPEWCEHIMVHKNGKPIQMQIIDSYACIPGPWADGDTLRIVFDIALQYLQADPRIGSLAGKAALQRGPIVYCFEGADNDDDLDGLCLDIGKSKETELVEGPFYGNPMLKVAGYRVHRQVCPYTPLVSRLKRCKLTAIPYFLWGNRGEEQMDVWLPWHL